MKQETVPENDAEKLDRLVSEFFEIYEEWKQKNLTNSGRLRPRVVLEDFERNLELAKRCHAMGDEISRILATSYAAPPPW